MPPFLEKDVKTEPAALCEDCLGPGRGLIVRDGERILCPNPIHFPAAKPQPFALKRPTGEAA